LPISKFRSICVATKHSQQYPYKPAEFKAQCESKNPLPVEAVADVEEEEMVSLKQFVALKQQSNSVQETK
jgi:hypothetical protein